ncbi:PREDICTED: probable NADH dehydrogenase [ubiquinone] 1 alpha subcomplex subunit 5, mitochondrial isoform X2 [Populus euphratica]|uniref:Probable NADH dehydrogenase [ubiquinone] 1 alpha subcomplex subunit 5, mitochondrial isoform X2 n=1 Tax=Populus euphratica TaxID=75702 RepID=A0AAJ6VCU1_POPEU|nr:PREDICTED: probable NADH dehydrogenase [ubiquinone] 1 alpha subcomplex subunit 5, mitochondrial isoform X2 [Populus euphratica]
MFLRAIGRPLLARVKQTTGIVGLDVVPNARAVLINLYSKTLKEIKAVPEDEGYRKAVETFTKHRLTVCEEEEEWEKIEERIDCGQVEEAQDELKLIGKMIGFPLDRNAIQPKFLIDYNRQPISRTHGVCIGILEIIVA